jgi:hypothetical protein
MSGISDSEAITLEELVKGQKKIEAHESFIETLFRLGVVDEATKWTLQDAYWPYDKWDYTFGYAGKKSET